MGKEQVSERQCAQCGTEIKDARFLKLTVQSFDMHATVYVHGVKCVANWLKAHQKDLPA